MVKLIFLQLNEINFDLISKYIEKGIDLPNFNKIISQGIYHTSSELNYHELEPWIQWVSVQTGKTYAEHGVFRLGDIVKTDHLQIFEKIEKKGFTVSAISPMNARNELSAQSFFVPDPWTKTKSDSRWYMRIIGEAIMQAVNDNSSEKVSVMTMLKLSLAMVYLLPLKSLIKLSMKLGWALQKKWRKAIFLDLILTETNNAILKKSSPDFASLFLNAGAHIQHHYMYNSIVIPNKNNPDWYISSKDDPLLEIFKAYDNIIGTMLQNENYELMLGTGLTQSPFKELCYYYRLRDHNNFFTKLNLEFESIFPRMTRDFLVVFRNNNQRDTFLNSVKKIKIGDVALFGTIDVRERELFITMDYPHEIIPGTELFLDHELLSSINLYEHVAFVAIKNGEHDQRGFVYASPGLPSAEVLNNKHVAEINKYIDGLY